PVNRHSDFNASTIESGENATFSRNATGAVLWLIPKAIKVMQITVLLSKPLEARIRRHCTQKAKLLKAPRYLCFYSDFES
ncbi:MAG: hypothetical protein ACI81A_001441, partial [Paraglaciecola sp.]